MSKLLTNKMKQTVSPIIVQKKENNLGKHGLFFRSLSKHCSHNGMESQGDGFFFFSLGTPILWSGSQFLCGPWFNFHILSLTLTSSQNSFSMNSLPPHVMNHLLCLKMEKQQTPGISSLLVVNSPALHMLDPTYLLE